MPNETPSRPLRLCLSCQSTTSAKPYQVILAAAMRTIFYRCECCGYHWVSSTPDRTLVVQ